MAHIEKLSVCGRLMRRVAYLCLALWPAVAARYRGVEYAGEVL